MQVTQEMRAFWQKHYEKSDDKKIAALLKPKRHRSYVHRLIKGGYSEAPTSTIAVLNKFYKLRREEQQREKAPVQEIDTD